jgi:hypothetical protein
MMAKVSRNDIYVRDERGADWFNSFLQSLAGTEPSSVQEILSAINNKRTETVDGIVQNYREQVGLDSLSSDEEDKDLTKQASAKIRPLSIRHAAEDKSVVQLIEDDQELKAKIDSHCEHTGGTKNIEALLSFLRGILGHQVSFSDKKLREYLEGRKNRFKDHTPERSSEDVGRVGTDSSEEHDDDKADYIKNDGAH